MTGRLNGCRACAESGEQADDLFSRICSEPPGRQPRPVRAPAIESANRRAFRASPQSGDDSRASITEKLRRRGDGRESRRASA
ncbi:hypothetical protein A33K_13094 [Burkholderia humptydooensis MSMB43]|uniref:Uncharacterized protein n=1 Tax=Burkholderia humptydooensis MSMB43 TaxID=441157 RepID=A0ABN0GBD5_9BURK|nr:hypothetical protein A33K_13094 [Burkholderia humptydooensis MSMB43]